MESSSIDSGVQVVRLESWSEFSKLVTDRFLRGPAYVFRGQTHFDWPLVSSLDRLEQRYPRRQNTSGGDPAQFSVSPLTEKQHLAAFQRAVAGRRGRNPPQLTDDQFWALGQHHGLATPLLDWTRAPFVALFFALEEESESESGPRGVFALSTSAIAHGQSEASQPAAPTDAARVISLISDENERLVHQGGLFLKMPRHTDLESHVRERFAGESRQAILIKVSVPGSGRHEALVTLNKMNINRMTLFPDIDGAARYVNSLWQPGHEDSIAFV